MLNYIFCFFVFYRYLATGDSFRTISFSYRVGHCTVARIVGEVCKVIWDCLVNEFMAVPKKDDWRAIADGFLQEWNFPNCVGSIDGKHVVVQAPSNSGSLYYNYKHTFSIVLLAVVDANLVFRMVDVGGYGRNSDGGTLSNSPFGQSLRDGTLDLAEDRVIPGAEDRGPMPYVLVADEAFPLRCNLMRPFPGTNLATGRRAFNYRFSRARLIVECTLRGPSLKEGIKSVMGTTVCADGALISLRIYIKHFCFLINSLESSCLSVLSSNIMTLTP